MIISSSHLNTLPAHSGPCIITIQWQWSFVRVKCSSVSFPMEDFIKIFSSKFGVNFGHIYQCCLWFPAVLKTTIVFQRVLHSCSVVTPINSSVPMLFLGGIISVACHWYSIWGEKASVHVFVEMSHDSMPMCIYQVVVCLDIKYKSMWLILSNSVYVTYRYLCISVFKGILY